MVVRVTLVASHFLEKCLKIPNACNKKAIESKKTKHRKSVQSVKRDTLGIIVFCPELGGDARTSTLISVVVDAKASLSKVRQGCCNGLSFMSPGGATAPLHLNILAALGSAIKGWNPRCGTLTFNTVWCICLDLGLGKT